MKAKTICPKCKKKVETDCEGCIVSGTLFHFHKGEDEPDILEAKWEIVEK